MIYRNTQLGTAILVTLAVVAAILLVVTALRPSGVSVVAVLVLAAIALGFGSLTVDVSQRRIQCWFGPGIARRNFDLAAVESVEIVRNRWFYGWGIRITPQGWMYNVSGLDAVELQLASGKRFRIGTDEPEQLQAAIEEGMERRRSSRAFIKVTP